MSLFDFDRPDFDGSTFDEQLDGRRLDTLMGRVFTFMRDGQWRTLPTIAEHCGGTEASVSARLRDLRKGRFGAHTVNHRRLPGDSGLWEYQLQPTGPLLDGRNRNLDTPHTVPCPTCGTGRVDPGRDRQIAEVIEANRELRRFLRQFELTRGDTGATLDSLLTELDRAIGGLG